MAGPRAFYTLPSWGWSFSPVTHGNLPKHKAWGRHRWLHPPALGTWAVTCLSFLMQLVFRKQTVPSPVACGRDPHPLQKLTLGAATCLLAPLAKSTYVPILTPVAGTKFTHLSSWHSRCKVCRIQWNNPETYFWQSISFSNYLFMYPEYNFNLSLQNIL